VAARAPVSFKPPLALVAEALKLGAWRSIARLRCAVRRSWFYRRLLTGQLADHISYHPADTIPRSLTDADALLRGRFRFQGETAEAGERSIFDSTPPSAEWLAALHSFAWLAPLSAAGGEAARTLATNLMTQWLRRNSHYTEPGWQAQILARRLIAIFAHGRFILSNSDMLWRSKVFVSLREQSKMLARIAAEAPDGLPRLEAAAALSLSGCCLDDSPKRLEQGLIRLEAELARQILPDGGHLSRSPEQLVEAYRLVVMVMETLAATGQAVPHAIRTAHDRMAPMLRFFRHGDGALALFNGGGEGDARMVQALLHRDDVKGQPFGYARHSGYHRLQAARTLVLFDCGTPPPGAFSAGAHAGCLSFELSSGHHRLIVNCGTAALAGHRRWQAALRATAAHSTVTLADTSSATVVREGWVRALAGARIVHGPEAIETRRVETEKGNTVVASHDGYVVPFAVRHERELTLSPHGLALTGTDRLLPRQDAKAMLPFAVRFHIHPDVRLSRAESGYVLLKLPNGEGWRFRATHPVSVEESVYVGGDAIRRSEQLVITAQVKNEPVEVGWIVEQIGVAEIR
jgi:uncharacterized heparinase superfamily protein